MATDPNDESAALTARIKANLDLIELLSEVLDEQERRRRLLRGDPPPRELSMEELRARRDELRASNDALEVEQIHYHTP